MHVLEKKDLKKKGQNFLTGLSKAVLLNLRMTDLCFLVPWCKSIVGSAHAKWRYFLLLLVQIRGKALALIPGGSDLVFQTLKLPTPAIWGSLCRLLAQGFFLCFLWHVLLTLPMIGNNQLFLTVRNWELRKNVKCLSKGCSTWLGFSSGKGWSGAF